MKGPGYGGSSLDAVALRAAGIAVVFALLPAGCIFHLDDPVPLAASGGSSGGATGGDSGAGGAPSSGGSAGASSSGGTTAGGSSGAAAAGGAAPCPMGKKRCGTDCVQPDPANGCSPNDNECTKCAQVDTANTTCSNGMCVVDSCKDGFGDCDGDDSNGCEIEFATLPQSLDPPVEAIRASKPVDWTKIRRHRINAVCSNCTMPQSPIPQVVDPALPEPKDLDAWFRTAWDDFRFYALVEVRDDELPPPESPMDGGDLDKLGPAVVEDAVELLISLDQSSGGFGVDDMQLFYGIDGTVQRPNQSNPAPTAPSSFKVKKGRGCYTVEVELYFAYMVSPGTMYTPTEGQTIGFTAAVNDWDYAKQADGGPVSQRHHHIFSKDPKAQYWSNANSFGTLTWTKP